MGVSVLVIGTDQSDSKGSQVMLLAPWPLDFFRSLQVNLYSGVRISPDAEKLMLGLR